MSIYALRPCHLVQIHKEIFLKTLEATKMRILQEKLSFLQSNELFSKFSYKSLKNLIKSLNVRKLNRHQFAYREGEKVDRMFIVRSGEFRIFKKIQIIHEDPIEKEAKKEGPTAAMWAPI